MAGSSYFRDLVLDHAKGFYDYLLYIVLGFSEVCVLDFRSDKSRQRSCVVHCDS